MPPPRKMGAGCYPPWALSTMRRTRKRRIMTTYLRKERIVMPARLNRLAANPSPAPGSTPIGYQTERRGTLMTT